MHISIPSNAYGGDCNNILYVKLWKLAINNFLNKLKTKITWKIDQIGKVVFARVFGPNMAMTRQQQPLGEARAPLRQVCKVSKITSNTH